MTFYNAIGLMSGTSLDGIDATLIETDGFRIKRYIASHYLSYPEAVRSSLADIVARNGKVEKEAIEQAQKAMTHVHVDAVQSLLQKAGLSPQAIDVIGFHGQTIDHRPDDQCSWQIGDGALLAQETKIDVVAQLRQHDVQSGGQGAPLVPIYHQALAANLPKPVLFLNIGGIANITYLGEHDDIRACDTGPGNALINDWVVKQTGQPYDRNGETASRGVVDQDLLDALLDHPYFTAPLPKSLDRNQFNHVDYSGLSTEDGAATLTAFTVTAIVKSLALLPTQPTAIYVMGGGRHNHYMMQQLAHEAQLPIHPAETLGYDGDMIEAEAFAFLAVRSLKNLPITFPLTTGAKQPLCGGTLYRC